MLLNLTLYQDESLTMLDASYQIECTPFGAKVGPLQTKKSPDSTFRIDIRRWHSFTNWRISASLTFMAFLCSLVNRCTWFKHQCKRSDRDAAARLQAAPKITMWHFCLSSNYASEDETRLPPHRKFMTWGTNLSQAKKCCWQLLIGLHMTCT